MDKKVKKLTVKDIVEECHITRQAFYYHFEDIPDMLKWMLERGAQAMREAGFGKDGRGKDSLFRAYGSECGSSCKKEHAD